MMKLLSTYVVPAALSLLPAQMSSREAVANLLAIAQQESGCAARVQMGGGPARGYWQMEAGGMIRAVLTNSLTAGEAQRVWTALDYAAKPTMWSVYDAVEHNDILAAAIARLGLYAVPRPLPAQEDETGGWKYYLAAWNPGKPRLDDWPASWRAGWTAVKDMDGWET